MLRRRRKEQQAGGFRAEHFDHGIFRACGLRCPREVVRFIDDEQVPAGIGGLLRTTRRPIGIQV